MPAHAQLSVAGQRNERVVVLFLVERVVQAVERKLFAGELRPLGARFAVVMRVQLGVGGKDFDATSDEQGQKEHVEPVVDAQPHRKVERRHSSTPFTGATPGAAGTPR